MRAPRDGELRVTANHSGAEIYSKSQLVTVSLSPASHAASHHTCGQRKLKVHSFILLAFFKYKVQFISIYFIFNIDQDPLQRR